MNRSSASQPPKERPPQVAHVNVARFSLGLAALRRVLAALGVALLAWAPAPVWACAACFGRSDDAMARGMNMGIFSLLVVVLFVLGGIGAFAIFLMRRAAQFPSLPLPEEPEPAAETGTTPGPMPLTPLSQPSK